MHVHAPRHRPAPAPPRCPRPYAPIRANTPTRVPALPAHTQARLPPPKPLTKSLLKQAALKDALKDAGDTKQAVAAVVALFVASASRPFHAVALAAVEEELAATAEAYAAYQKEPVAKAAARKVMIPPPLAPLAPL